MIYVDTSVALAYLYAEANRPTDDFWLEPLYSSRLFEYELRVRVNHHPSREAILETADWVLEQVAFVELESTILARIFEPFPGPVRTLDALHLASVTYLQEQHPKVVLATYDQRMLEVAKAMHLTLHEWCP